MFQARKSVRGLDNKSVIGHMFRSGLEIVQGLEICPDLDIFPGLEIVYSLGADVRALNISGPGHIFRTENNVY